MSLQGDDRDGRSSRDASPTEIREYAIFATILKDRSLRDTSKTPMIRQQTFALDGLDLWSERGKPGPVCGLIDQVPGLLKETIEDYLEKNRDPIELKPVEMGFPYLLLPESERRRLFDGPGRVEARYRQLRQDYPQTHGLITLSRVGFDRDWRQSIVAFGQQFGGRCGHGHYIFLEIHDGCWFVKRSEFAWRS